MTLFIPAALFITGLLCCIVIALFLVRDRGNRTSSKDNSASIGARTEPVSPLAAASVSKDQPAQAQTSATEQEKAALSPSLADAPKTEPHEQDNKPAIAVPAIPALSEMEQTVQLFQNGQLAPEWWREQFQELSVKVQDMRQQSALIERHITILNQLAAYMTELEQVRSEYAQLRERRSAVLGIPKQLPLLEESNSDDTYIHTEQSHSMKPFTLKTT